MKITNSSYDQLSADDHDELSEGLEQQGMVALLEMPDDVIPAAEEWIGKRCEKCDAPMKSEMVTVCRKCGWYASLNQFVEIDANWETADSDEEAPPRPQTSHAKVWSELVPWWARAIIASVLVVIVESVVARLVTPAGSELRMMWSLTQLALGTVTVLGFHVFNFMVQATEDADVGVLDLLIKPIKLWFRAFNKMPEKWWVTDAAICGVVANIMAVLVIGGIPYERFWDWGFTPPAKQSLMAAVTDRVKQVDGKGADNLEDAVGDFAGKAGIDEDQKTPSAKPRKNADCVIVGYQLDKDEKLSALVLGTAHLGKLVYAGNVAPKFADDAEALELMGRLMKSRTNQRLLPVEMECIWVKPTITLRVTFEERKKDGRLTDVKWDTLLGTISTKKK